MRAGGGAFVGTYIEHLGHIARVWESRVRRVVEVGRRVVQRIGRISSASFSSGFRIWTLLLAIASCCSSSCQSTIASCTTAHSNAVNNVALKARSLLPKLNDLIVRDVTSLSIVATLEMAPKEE